MSFFFGRTKDDHIHTLDLLILKRYHYIERIKNKGEFDLRIRVIKLTKDIFRERHILNLKKNEQNRPHHYVLL